MSVVPMQFIFAYNYLLFSLFSLSTKRCFRWNLLKRNYFFLVQKCKHQILGGPSLLTKRLHALHAYVYTLRGQEEKNLVLLRRFMQRLMRLTICQPAGLSSLVLQRTRIT